MSRRTDVYSGARDNATTRACPGAYSEITQKPHANTPTEEAPEIQILKDSAPTI
jgi:hypothetical protein